MKNFIKSCCIAVLITSFVFPTAFATSPERYKDIQEIINNGVALSLPQTLGILYPKVVSTTTEDNFYIAGISDPSQPLYMNDKEISDRAPNGMFEVTISIPQDGTYSCIFKQGDVTKVVPIFKNVVADISYNNFALPTVISKKIEPINSSLFPTQSLIINDKKVTLQCTAPAGAEVKAQFCGSIFKLVQEKTAEVGVPAKYSVDIDLTSYLEDDKTYTLGDVIYTVDFQGNISQNTSEGKIYYSKSLPPFVRVSWEYAFLREGSLNNLDETISVLKKGVVDRVVREEKEMYQLGCGGWVSKKFVEPIFEQISVVNDIHNVEFKQDTKTEQLVLKGTCNPVFTSGMMDKKFIVRLYNTVENLDLSSLSQYSVLFDSISSKSENGYLELVFNLKTESSLWGYNIQFDENDTIICLKKKPVLSTDSNKPLQNITVVVDPGHGGSDPGTPGLIGLVGGSCEKDINLVNALAVKKRLESLGANVVMTRDSDKYISLSGRANVIEKSIPDFVIILHADASAINTMTKGLTVHYTTDNRFSMPFSSLLSNVATSYIERENRGLKNTNFYVSRTTWCPLAFCELGYLTNPTDTASLFSSNGIFGIANSVGDSIVTYLSQQ